MPKMITICFGQIYLRVQNKKSPDWSFYAEPPALLFLFIPDQSGENKNKHFTWENEKR